VVREFEEVRHIFGSAIGVARVGQLDVGIPELVEEWVHHGLDSGETLSRGVLKQFRNEINRVRISFAEDLDYVSG
jgi:ribose 1,5-bisphosphokinase PhnN